MIPDYNRWFDWIALVNLLVLWIGYTRYASWKGRETPCLASVLELYRRDWMKRLLGRDNRVADASLLHSLRTSVSFFASTSILVIAGLITGFASADKAVSVLSVFPFVTTNTREMWELKILVMLVIFVYSFFEFTWSLRLYNFCCVMLGSAPLIDEVKGNELEQQAFSRRSGHIMTMAANHFNYGLRAYYFALSTMVWFIHPLLFMVSTFMVVAILYRREFYSTVLDALAQSERE